VKNLREVSLLLSVLALTLTLAGVVRVGATDEGMITFLDSTVPGINIQVNATAQTQPTKNMTVVASLRTRTTVYVEHFNLEVFGYINGTAKLSMVNVTENNFSLNSTSNEYDRTFSVPDQVWGVTYGEITLTYSTSLAGLDLRFPNIVTGFPMTQVENTFLETLQDQVKSLNQSYNQLTDLYLNLSSRFEQLNNTYTELYRNYTLAQGSLGELDTTRRLTTVLAITTALFVVTTIFLVVRRPKERW
jgi:hypothetical protein